MKQIIYASFIMILLATCSMVIAAPETNQQLQQNLQSAQRELTLLKEQSEINILKAQLQSVEKYQDKLLATVYWSLATVGTVAILLVGFSWFNYSSAYERDKSALRNELLLIIKDESQKLQLIIGNELTDSKEIIKEEIKKTTEEKNTALKETIDSNLRDLTRKLVGLQLDVLNIEHKEWEKTRVMSNAARISRKMLELAVTNNMNHSITRILDRIQNDLKIILTEEKIYVLPDAEDISNLVRVLDQVNPEHSLLVTSLKEMLLKIRQLKI